jgi:glycosyltransferase involved in cell wall biosynthesis
LIVDNWKDADIVFCFSITTLDKSEVYEAKKAGKKLVLRVDNIPRKSRNTRCSPVERLSEFGAMADLVVYQSIWCKQYAGYFIKNNNEVIINNGVDTEIFNTKDRNSDGKTFLYINYNDNPNKRFDEALYWFDMEWRKNNEYHLVIAGNIPSIYIEHPEFNWDIPTKGRVEYVGILNTQLEVAKLMKKCDFLLYPAFADAYPNTLLEAIACGLEPISVCSEGGANEVVGHCEYGILDIKQMAENYLEEFNKLI